MEVGPMKTLKVLCSIYGLVTAWLIVSMLLSITLLFLPYGDRLVEFFNPPKEKYQFYRLTLIVFMSGVLGGALQGSRGMYYKLKLNEPLSSEFEKRFGVKLWVYSIAFRPIKGGILSLIVLSLLNAGFLGFSNTTPTVESLYFQISLGFLVGYGAYEVLKKIDEIIKITFTSAKGSDPEDSFRTKD
jgi:hypothetical protein